MWIRLGVLSGVPFSRGGWGKALREQVGGSILELAPTGLQELILYIPSQVGKFILEA